MLARIKIRIDSSYTQEYDRFIKDHVGVEIEIDEHKVHNRSHLLLKEEITPQPSISSFPRSIISDRDVDILSRDFREGSMYCNACRMVYETKIKEEKIFCICKCGSSMFTEFIPGSVRQKGIENIVDECFKF